MISRVAAFGVLLLIGSAVPADAQWRWLEHMSGPGWYDGVSIEQKLLCWYPGDGQKMLVAGAGVSLKCITRKRTGTGEPDIDRHRLFTLGVSGAVMWSTRNRLEYPAGVGPEETQVWVVAPGVYADVRIPLRESRRRWLDNLEFGGSLEGFRMDAKVMPTSIWRLAKELRFTLNLITIRNAAANNTIAHVKLRAGTLWMHGDLRPQDFGAIPGPPLNSKQVHTSVRLLFDIECYPWTKEC